MPPRALKFLLLTLLLRPFGNLILALGMRQVPQHLSLNPWLYLAAMANPYVASGILLLVLSMLTRLALLSVADLSLVLPLTALGYVVSTLLGQVFLNESVSIPHWLGTLLIFAGVAFVGSTGARANGI